MRSRSRIKIKILNYYQSGKLLKVKLRKKVTEFDLRSRSRKKMSGPDAQELADGKTKQIYTCSKEKCKNMGPLDWPLVRICDCK